MPNERLQVETVVLTDPNGTLRPPESPDEGSPSTPAPSRYLDRGAIGRGGMGEVRRVLDVRLNREVALKSVRRMDADLVSRFRHEAQVTAQLQHPGIVPVYEAGQTADGRPYFTMREVIGRTLAAVVRDHHDAADDPGGVGLRRLVEALRRVCDAVGYAHSRGVTHRDLKPQNVMVGEHGEVLVLDWGLAKATGLDEPTSGAPVVTSRSLDLSAQTRIGTVTGTPRYMSPEQARGEGDDVGPRSDVYALGAMLYQVLCGRPPFSDIGDESEVLEALASDRSPPPPSALSRRRVPDELERICLVAMSPRQADRFADARTLGIEVDAWLEGTRRRAEAARLVDRARERHQHLVAERRRAQALRLQAAERLSQLAADAPQVERLSAWQLEDGAADIEARCETLEAEFVQDLRSALEHDSGLDDAHALLADHFAEKHREAEAAGHTRAARQLEVALRAHDRGAHAAYLVGAGTISIAVDAPGARATLHRLVVESRRIRPVLEADLGELPLVGHALPMGNYLLEISAPSRATVRYPVQVLRRGNWAAQHPRTGAPVSLPDAAAVGPDDVVVPAGWFLAGGEAPDTKAALPRQWVWVDGVVARRFPVTNAEYLDFLNALVADGREDRALSLVPRAVGTHSRQGDSVLARRPDGSFAFHRDEHGHEWLPRMPIVQVGWDAARAYAAWYAERTGLPWRLPYELEWEKAARGVDGRPLPWGSHFEPTWCRMRDTPGVAPGPAAVDDFPLDESPYGVRGLAGNVMDWCLDPSPALPAIDGDGVMLRPVVDEQAAVNRAVRGGRWFDVPAHCQVHRRRGVDRAWHQSDTGIRLFRSYG